MSPHGHTVETLQAFEKEVADAFNVGRIRAPIHLSGGNELQLLKVFEDVGPSDWIFTTWRSHYHCLLRGVPPDRLMADILAGRSITLNYPEFRVVSSAIVGGILPIALGVALEIKRQRLPERVHAFIGDMTALTGVAFEVSNYARWNDLPLSIVVEDNGKSVTTDTRVAWGGQFRGELNCDGPWSYHRYDLPWPHSGAGKRVEF